MQKARLATLGRPSKAPEAARAMGHAGLKSPKPGSAFETTPAPNGASPLNDRPHGHNVLPSKTPVKYSLLRLPESKKRPICGSAIDGKSLCAAAAGKKITKPLIQLFPVPPIAQNQQKANAQNSLGFLQTPYGALPPVFPFP
ncbi:hypothetical protein [Rhodobacter ferrooxidans]|uniref:hypothetical protein n=1 Tax=Rhodobacter ferrooxidans TaxID=371731 RepID=UPI0012E9F997|nr:hypothetical protein [Rhodobacter sp. SW2]